MSRLEGLIAELCPDGVEYKPLWSVTIWDKRFNSVDKDKQPQVINYNYLLAADLFALQQDDGDVFLLSTGEQTGWTTETLAGENMSEGEVITIPWGKSRAVVDCIKYYRGKFVTADNRIMTSNDTAVLNNKFLYYVIMSCGKKIDSFYRGSGIKHPNMSKVLCLEIPVPPLPVQREIVRILDNFTKLTTKLTAELTARKKQYEYYRDALLSAETSYPIKALGEICDFVRGPFGGSLKKEIFTSSGYAVYEQQHAIYGDFKFRYFIDEDKFNEMHRFEVKPGDLIMSCSGTMGKISIIPDDAPQGVINQALLKLTARQGISNKYLKYCFENSITAQMNAEAQGGAIKNVASVAILKRIKISVPPLEKQKCIVSILDRFDTLCNDITKGLPAEIEARQKQYEYYRDKLLTFKKLA